MSRTSGYAEDWRNRSAHASGRSLQLMRAATTILVLFLLACLILVIYWQLVKHRSPVLRIACLRMDEFDVLAAAPIGFARSDDRILKQLCARSEHDASNSTAESGQAPDDFATHLTRASSGPADVLLCAIWARPLLKSNRLVFADSAWEPRLDTEDASTGYSNTVTFRYILAAVAESPAKHKVLVLDAGRNGGASLSGALVWDLPRLVREELRRLDASSGPIWVFLANSAWEQSHVSLREQRSFFFHYLSEALHGAADGFGDRPADGQIDLAEVYQYVRHRVAARVWAASDKARTQTPTLLLSTLVRDEGGQRGSEGPTLERAGRVVLRALPRRSRTDEAGAGRDVPESEADAKEGSAVESAVGGSDKQQDRAADAALDSNEQPGNSVPDGPSSEEAPAESPGDASLVAVEPSSEAPGIGSPSSTSQEFESGLDLLADRFPSLTQVLRLHGSPTEHRLAGSGWEPIDFAPHWVRRFEESMAAYRLRALSAPEADIVVSDTRLIVGDHRGRLREWAQDFYASESRRTWDQSQRIKEIVRTRNEALFELPDYIRMQTQLPAKVLPSHFHREVEHLVETLGLLTEALEAGVFEKPPIAGSREMRLVAQVGPGGRDEDLAELCAEINKSRKWLRKHLGLLPADVLDIPADDLFLIDLLTTALPGPVLQTRFVSHLVTPTDNEHADLEFPGPSRVEADDAGKRAREQSILRAQLELAAWMLTCSDPEERERLQNSMKLLQDQLQQVAVAPADASSLDRELFDLLLETDAQIRSHVNQAIQRLPWTSGTPVTHRTEITLRLLPGWIAAKFDGKSSVPIWAPYRQHPRIQDGLAFERPSPAEDGAIQLSPEGKIFHWKLRSPAGKMPTRLKMIVRNPDQLLEVTGQGRSLDGGVDWLIEGGDDSQEEYDLPLHIRPRTDKKGGAITNVTITLPDEGGQSVSVDFRLPEPSQLLLSLTGPAGTLDGDLQALALGADRQAEEVRKIEFNTSGDARIVLRPYASGAPTRYVVTVRNPSSRDWPVKLTVWAIPDEQRQRAGPGFRPWGESAADRSTWVLFSELKDWVLAGNEPAELPLFPQSTPPDPAPESDEQAPVPSSSPEPGTVDVTGGLLCVLEHAGGRQRLWLDMQPLHPEAYLQPDVMYDDQGSIRIQVRASDRQVLPPGLSSIRWEISPELRALVQQVREPGDVDLRQNEFTEFGARFSPGRSLPSSVPIVLSADGYPRAFAYELPLSRGSRGSPLVNRTSAQVVLCELDEQGQLKRDEQQRPVEIASGSGFRHLPHIGVMLRADTPPPERVGSDFRLRVYLQGTLGLTTGATPGESKEFFRDRQCTVQIQKPQSSPGFLLTSRVDELTAVLRNSFSNDKIVVRWEIEEWSRGQAEPVVTKGDDSIYLIHDVRPPQIDGVESSRIRQGSPITVRVREDDGTGIAALWYSFELDGSGNLEAPKKIRDPRNTTGLASFQVPSEELKPGRHMIHLSATDVAGNSGDVASYAIEIEPPPPPPKPEPEKVAPELKEIHGQVVYRSGYRGATVKLTGPTDRNTVSDLDGKFRFRDLPPGEYRVSAAGPVGGIPMVAPPEPVVLTDADKSKEVILRLKLP